MGQSTLINILLGAAYCVSTLSIGYYAKQEHWLSLLIPSFFAFLFFIVLLLRILKFDECTSIIWFFLGLTKIGLIFAFPQLSDDIYRYWWDGWLSFHAINPYILRPTEIMEGNYPSAFLSPLASSFEQLNSKNYYSVYPPMSQLLFLISSSLALKDIYAFSMVLKLFYLLADVFTIYFLFQILSLLNKPKAWAFLYAANPTIQIELLGNLHTEQFMILFLTAAIYFSLKQKAFSSGLSMGLSAFSKLNSLLFAPMFIFLLNPIKNAIKFTMPLTALILSFLIILNEHLFNYWSSLQLYFKTFEFNSFVYAGTRDWLFEHKYYQLKDQLGLILMLPFLVYFLYLLISNIKKPVEPFPFQLFWRICFVFLLLSSTVHPWYICPLLLLSVFCYPVTSLVWSFTVLFSYAYYDSLFMKSVPFFQTIQYSSCLILFYLESKQPNLFAKHILRRV